MLSGDATDAADDYVITIDGDVGGRSQPCLGVLMQQQLQLPFKGRLMVMPMLPPLVS